MDLPTRRRLMNNAAQPAPRIQPPLTFLPSIVCSLLFFPIYDLWFWSGRLFFSQAIHLQHVCCCCLAENLLALSWIDALRATIDRIYRASHGRTFFTASVSLTCFFMLWIWSPFWMVCRTIDVFLLIVVSIGCSINMMILGLDDGYKENWDFVVNVWRGCERFGNCWRIWQVLW